MYRVYWTIDYTDINSQPTPRHSLEAYGVYSIKHSNSYFETFLKSEKVFEFISVKYAYFLCFSIFSIRTVTHVSIRFYCHNLFYKCIFEKFTENN